MSFGYLGCLRLVYCAVNAVQLNLQYPLWITKHIRGCFFLVIVVQMHRLKQPSDYCQGFLDRFNMAQHGTKQATCYLHYEKDALNIIRIPASFCLLKIWLHRKFAFLSKDINDL